MWLAEAGTELSILLVDESDEPDLGLLGRRPPRAMAQRALNMAATQPLVSHAPRPLKSSAGHARLEQIVERWKSHGVEVGGKEHRAADGPAGHPSNDEVRTTRRDL